MMVRKFVLGVAAIACACDTGGAARPGTGFGTVLDPEGHLHFRGLVRDRATKAPLAGALVAVEVGGLYQAFDDTSKASPFFRFGGITSDDGRFDLALPPGRIGVHTFRDGYICGGRFSISDLTQEVTIDQTSLPATLDGEGPIVAGFDVVPYEIAPGGDIVLGADVQAGKATPPDPLSDEVLVVEPTTGWSGELDPPTRGDRARGYPEGHYSRTIAAPLEPGVYTYSLVTMSEGCLTSAVQTATITVRP